MEKFSHSKGSFQIDRYPETNLSSLKPWNAADEYLLAYIEENNLQNPLTIVNDRFGFLALALQQLKPTLIIDYKSQEKAIHRNLNRNGVKPDNYSFETILSENITEQQVALLKVPKSLELFALYLHQIARMLTTEGTLLAGFMTKYFTPSMLEVASRYFGKVEQSRAWKKSRLLILSEPRKEAQELLTETVPLSEAISLSQFKGVFSSGKIDVGTRFLLEHLLVAENETTILDLACGNGIIAYHMAAQNPAADLHLVDDFYLAVESARMNLPNATCYLNNELDEFAPDFFDLIVTNPPFHFGHETNIEVSLTLFKQSSRCLKPTGRLVVVANRHLNYSSHLRQIYRQVSITAENPKFQLIECRNAR